MQRNLQKQKWHTKKNCEHIERKRERMGHGAICSCRHLQDIFSCAISMEFGEISYRERKNEN